MSYCYIVYLENIMDFQFVRFQTHLLQLALFINKKEGEDKLISTINLLSFRYPEMMRTSEQQWQQQSKSLDQNEDQMIEQANLESQEQNENNACDSNDCSSILSIFLDSNKFQQVTFANINNQSSMTKILWRIHYLLGEIFLSIQNELVQNQILNQCILLQYPQIEKITSFLIQKAKRSSMSPGFLKIKSLLQQIYTQNDEDLEKISELYSEIIKISRTILKFEMVIESNTEQTLLIKPISENKESVCISIDDNYNQVRKTITKKADKQKQIEGFGITIKDLNKIINKKQMDQQVGKKWDEAEQAVLCKIYSQTDSPATCIKVLEKHVGPDLRWSFSNQIQARIMCIVNKVFNKFARMLSSNTCIQTFIKNRKKVFALSQIEVKRQIFRKIAVINFYMIKKSGESKRIISQKMYEVNQLCQDTTLFT